MGTAAVLAGAALATSAAGAYAQYEAGKSAEKKQEKARAVSQASAQVENARQRRRAIAQARIAQAQNVAQQGSEVQSSSGLAGVQSSLSTQLGANIGAQQQRFASQTQIGNLNQSAANRLRRGQNIAGFANLASQGFMLGAQAQGFGSQTPNNPQGQPLQLQQQPYQANFGFN